MTSSNKYEVAAVSWMLNNRGLPWCLIEMSKRGVKPRRPLQELERSLYHTVRTYHMYFVRRIEEVDRQKVLAPRPKKGERSSQAMKIKAWSKIHEVSKTSTDFHKAMSLKSQARFSSSLLQLSKRAKPFQMRFHFSRFDTLLGVQPASCVQAA